MSNNKKIIATIGLIIVLAFSFLLFFGISTSSKTSIDISAFIFILVTEFIIYGCIFTLTAQKRNLFMISGLSSLTFLYSVCSLLFNVLLKGIFNSLRGILIFNFSILLIYAFVIVLLFLFKKENK